jgi:rod shape-determining protein MreD
MKREDQLPRTPMTISALVALMLAIIPLPNPLDVLRPDFLVLVVFYWSIIAPRVGGLGLAFIAGLALDVLHGMVLGQHAFALTLMAAWATQVRLRVRVFSMLHQSLTIFTFLALYQFILFWIDGATGNPVTNLSRWFAPVIGALIWPVLAGFLNRLNER